MNFGAHHSRGERELRGIRSGRTSSGMVLAGQGRLTESVGWFETSPYALPGEVPYHGRPGPCGVVYDIENSGFLSRQYKRTSGSKEGEHV